MRAATACPAENLFSQCVCVGVGVWVVEGGEGRVDREYRMEGVAM